MDIPKRFDIPGFRFYQEYRFCNKDGCKPCESNEGHGPYWFRYDFGTGMRKYIGRTLPYEVRLCYESLEQQKDYIAQEMDRHRAIWAALQRLYERRPLLPGDEDRIADAGIRNVIYRP